MIPPASRGRRTAAAVVVLVSLSGWAAAQAQTPDAFTPDPNDSVYAIAVQPDGRILIGGQFSSLDGNQILREKIARLHPDGTVDTSFDPGTVIAPGSVRAMALQPDGKIVVGGFDTVNRRHIARLNADGSLDATFTASANGAVNALALQPDGRIIVGGAFSMLQGGGSGPMPRSGVGRLNADGSVDASFNPGTNGLVRALLLQADGRVLVGGSFTGLGGGTRHNIGRLHADGSLDAAFDPGAGSHPAPRVSAFAIQPDGKILVGGRFTTLGGGGVGTALRNSVGRLETNGSIDPTFDAQLEAPAPCDCDSSSVESLAVLPNRTILVGGTAVFLEDGETMRDVIRVDISGNLVTFDGDVDSTVRAIVEQVDGRILLGGDFYWTPTDQRYVVRLDVGVRELTKLVGSSVVGGLSWQGYSVALSADGNTAIVGGPQDTFNRGGAWVWTRGVRIVGTPGLPLVFWSQQSVKLVGSGSTGSINSQGYAVALSADGNTAIVGGPDDNSGAGAAWVWTRTNGVWTQQGSKLVGSNAIGGTVGQGVSVALSADGNTAVVGGLYDNTGVGAVWVWTRNALGVWSQQGQKLVAADAAGPAWQGTSVALSADGNTLMVGGRADDNWMGAVWVWTRSGGVWTRQGPKLVGTGGVGPFVEQGASVSLSADGNTAIVGAFADNNFRGAAWVWTRAGGSWTQQGAKLDAWDAIDGAQQGESVSMAADGNSAIVGGSRDSGATGASWIWTRREGVWTQRESKVVAWDFVGSPNQGRSVAMSGDGSTIVVGAPFDDGNVGAAWASSAPVAVTQAATAVTATSAVLNAVVTSNTGAIVRTTASFQYGTSTSYGKSIWVPALVTPGITAIPVNAAITGLTCGTLYHARAVAAGDLTTYGADVTFTTVACAPVVATLAATNVSATGATFNATVTPNGADTALFFDYGLTTSYGSTLTVGSVGSGTTPLAQSLGVSGLSCGTTYHYRARAQHVGGSADGFDQTFTTGPCAPTITGLTAGNTQLTVAFTAGATGGVAVTNYKYSIDSGVTWVTRTPPSTASPLIVAGLTNGTTYQVQLRAVNVIGDGAPSTAMAGTPATTPGAPAISAIVPASAQLTVAFAAGADGGASITNYKYSTDGGATWITRSPASVASPLVITGLANGTTYQVQMRAVNGMGDGTPSPSVAATPGTTAGAPAIIGVTPGNSQLSVSFVAGADGGAPIANYRYSTDGGATWIARSPAATTSPLIIAGLVNGTTYQVRLRAVNTVGDGVPSAAVAAVPSTTPEAPALTGIKSGHSQLTLTFAPGPDGGSPIANYEYSIDAGASWTARTPAAVSSPVVITGLTNGTVYQVLLRAVNANGAGPPTAAAAATPAIANDETADAFDPGANGDVFTIAVQPDGRILVGGSFTSLGGGGTGSTPRNNLGRLYPDGSVDSTFDPGANIATGGFVTAVVVQPDGKILVGSGGVIPTTRRHIGRLHADGSRDPSFDFISANDTVRAIALQADGRILVGGSFTTLSGAGTGPLMRHRLGRINPDGTVDPGFNPGADGDITALTVQADGRILVGGSFTAIGGGTGVVARHNLARLNADGSVDTSFDPGAGTASSPIVRALRVQADGRILVGGRFTTLGGGGVGTTLRHNIGRLHVDGSVDLSFDPGPPPAEIPAAPSVVESILLLPGGKMLVGGLSAALEYSDLMPRHLARRGADGSLDADFEPRADGRVSALAAQADGRILVGGQFTSIGGTVRNRLARLGAPASLPPAGSSAPFTDDPIVAGVTPLKAIHIAELRARIGALQRRFNVAETNWTDANLAGTVVRAVHVQQLRDALLAVYDAAFMEGRAVTRPVFADGPQMAVGGSIRALHIEQLRTAVRLLETQ